MTMTSRDLRLSPGDDPVLDISYSEPNADPSMQSLRLNDPDQQLMGSAER